MKYKNKKITIKRILKGITIRFFYSVNRIEEAIIILWEKLNGLDFTESLSDEKTQNILGLDPVKSHCYEATNRKLIKKVLHNLKITDKDKIIDIGCGKGAVIKIMLKFPFAGVDGIEISDKLAEISRKNFKKMGSRLPCIYTKNAIEFEGYDNYNYFYFFNPFPSEVMVKVLEKIVDSIHRKPRKVRIIYGNPWYHDDVIKTNAFSEIATYTSWYSTYPIKIYSNFEILV